MRIDLKLRRSIVEGISVFLSLFDDNPDVKHSFCPPKTLYDPGANPVGRHGIALPPMAQLIEQGKVTALNFPVAMNPGLARAIGTMLKQAFQRAVLNRIPQMSAEPGTPGRPVLFLCDEYQAFATTGENEPSGDEKFFSLERQARCIPIVATQSISSLRSALTGESWRTLLQGFRTKIFLSLSDDFGARMAADLCGKAERLKAGYTLAETNQDASASSPGGRPRIGPPSAPRRPTRLHGAQHVHPPQPWRTPAALYTDWKNVYVRAATAEGQLTGAVPLTQFGRMCATLGNHRREFTASQGPGRAQPRDPSGSSGEETPAPRHRGSGRGPYVLGVDVSARAQRPLRARAGIGRGFSSAYAWTRRARSRVPARGHPSAVEGLGDPIRHAPLSSGATESQAPARRTVTVREAVTGAIEIRYRGRLMRWREIPAPPSKSLVAPATAPVALVPARGRPNADHPWRPGISSGNSGPPNWHAREEAYGRCRPRGRADAPTAPCKTRGRVSHNVHRPSQGTFQFR